MGRLPDRTRLRKRLRRWRRPAWLGSARRTTPLSDVWGWDRGEPVDRYYIERFLERHRGAIRGHVLEVKDPAYTRQLGSNVTHSDVLDIAVDNPRATIVADLCTADAIRSDTFDCFILTQTLQFIYDVPAALFHAHRILRPGGTLLCTAPTVSRIEHGALEHEYWRFTSAGLERLVKDAFIGGDVEVRSFGNVLTSVAFLLGMARQELSERELDRDQPYFPLIVCGRATKAPVPGPR